MATPPSGAPGTALGTMLVLPPPPQRLTLGRSTPGLCVNRPAARSRRMAEVWLVPKASSVGSSNSSGGGGSAEAGAAAGNGYTLRLRRLAPGAMNAVHVSRSTPPPASASPDVPVREDVPVGVEVRLDAGDVVGIGGASFVVPLLAAPTNAAAAPPPRKKGRVDTGAAAVVPVETQRSDSCGGEVEVPPTAQSRTRAAAAAAAVPDSLGMSLGLGSLPFGSLGMGGVGDALDVLDAWDTTARSAPAGPGEPLHSGSGGFASPISGDDRRGSGMRPPRAVSRLECLEDQRRSSRKEVEESPGIMESQVVRYAHGDNFDL